MTRSLAGLIVGAASIVLLPGSLLAGSAPAAVRAEAVVGGLEIPWEVDFAPDGRLFITERPGRVRIVEKGRLLPEPWATIPEVAHVGEGGLLGLALAPDFERSRHVYLYHTYESGGRLFNRVIWMVDRSGRGQRDRVILDGIPGAGTHDGGRIKFGPDGKLYVTTGDARQTRSAQDRNSLSGKILRLNPDGSIPPDNPFPHSPVYSFGHRNPQGLAWHPDTRLLFVAEHGPSGDVRLCCHDEINLVEPGKNYGWPEVAGVEGDPRFVDPIAESGSFTTWAPSGAVIPMRGPWRGSLLVALLRGNHLRRFVLAPPDFRRVASQEPYLDDLGRLRTVVEAPDGTLYVLTNNRDGRGRQAPNDDRLLRLVVSEK